MIWFLIVLLAFPVQGPAAQPPIKIPIAKNKFHISFFQSYLKKGIFVGKHAAHTCLSDELIPNDLLPIINNTGTVNPINGPAMYHGQGCFIQSKIFIKNLFADTKFSKNCS